MRTRTTKRLWLGVSLFVISALILTGAVDSIAAKRETAKRTPKLAGEDLKGIPFDDFWNRVKDEGRKWAGDTLYVSRISALMVDGFDKHNGLSAVWEAQVVRCSSVKEHKDGDSKKTETICTGKSMTYRMAEAGITGSKSGFHGGRELNFNGGAVQIDRIKFGAQKAEEIANGNKRLRPLGYEYYTYELNVNRVSNRPIWTIKKGCNHRGQTEKQCKPKDSWTLKIDAETGEVRNK